MPGGGVLVVEDDEDIRADLTAILRVKGFAVDEAANGTEALARLHDGARPCVIVLDLMMPGMNGWELRQVMLQDARLAAIPVIVVSGKGRIAHDEEQALSPAAVLVKPFELTELLSLVARYCERGQAVATR
ncbi:MAG: response regulator [Polyangia bacterium]